MYLVLPGITTSSVAHGCMYEYLHNTSLAAVARLHLQLSKTTFDSSQLSCCRSSSIGASPALALSLLPLLLFFFLPSSLSPNRPALFGRPWAQRVGRQRLHNLKTHGCLAPLLHGLLPSPTVSLSLISILHPAHHCFLTRDCHPSPLCVSNIRFATFSIVTATWSSASSRGLGASFSFLFFFFSFSLTLFRSPSKFNRDFPTPATTPTFTLPTTDSFNPSDLNTFHRN
ncbi:hypothetical protein ASPWEDRAFT_487101 [Aspergillus wentii DTO 134E9]|uniref:Uncharacterized protein n=1 Tax=Aspergillus wentii DTO 134E9 TaxID=1073089 RepID=A0A1L9RJ59_ASPWE|nr:uncharacterized protein ASPWEDRAFT_487101 [Aspergillus wentii DTO 134E9]OJJ34972.1 hypothetical protein ASPWEDRAFT_487101 [Aspergillus wentii DTO 134E9]